MVAIGFDKQYVALYAITVCVLASLIFEYLRPGAIFEFIITTGFGALVALAVPGLSGKNDNT